VVADLDRLESVLSGLGPGCAVREDITRRLQTILSKWLEAQGTTESDDSDTGFESATPDEIFGFLDEEFGESGSS
jgi:hypothetical protein